MATRRELNRNADIVREQNRCLGCGRDRTDYPTYCPTPFCDGITGLQRDRRPALQVERLTAWEILALEKAVEAVLENRPDMAFKADTERLLEKLGRTREVTLYTRAD